jgi:hypothetical protein
MTRSRPDSLTYIRTALVAGLVASSATFALAQSPQAGAPPGMADRTAMMAKMAAGDQKLTELVARMDAATGEEKIAAIAAVVRELTTQHRQMREHGCMQGGMAGMMPQKPEPAEKETEADHAAHHPEK